MLVRLTPSILFDAVEFKFMTRSFTKISSLSTNIININASQAAVLLIISSTFIHPFAADLLPQFRIFTIIFSAID